MVGPTTGLVVYTQDFDTFSSNPIRNNNRNLWDHQFACSRYTSRFAICGICGKNSFNHANDRERDTFRGLGIILGNIRPQIAKVKNRLMRPDYLHANVGITRSRLEPHDDTHFLTLSCDTLFPDSSEAMARLMPATCQSFTSRYSCIASAARNARLRPVLLANFSSFFLTERSTRTENVAVVFICVHTTTPIPRRKQNAKRSTLIIRLINPPDVCA